MSEPGWTRRETILAVTAASLFPTDLVAAQRTMRTRAIPSTGEALPVIGLGTYDVFDVSGTPAELAARRGILDRLLEAGGSVVDTSPMYNRSERVIGDLVAAGVERDRLFLATKVWTDGKTEGARQMRRSAELMRTEVVDLMQVHNLRDTAAHMATIRDQQAAGRIRYSGLTHYTAGAQPALADAMRRHRPDFIQINYSLGEREADARLLPLAADQGVAVIINRPYQAGRLFRAVRGRELPGWAQEFAASWGQFFLKFIVSHPAVTCAIPATSKPEHMADNLQAGFGALPDAATRRRMIAFFEAL
ncbi:MAG: aldo/keto reductase [Woeseiaceae bacterium]|nr:aldo/keto reductase [Woeseiaceae bacterium]